MTCDRVGASIDAPLLSGDNGNVHAFSYISHRQEVGQNDLFRSKHFAGSVGRITLPFKEELFHEAVQNRWRGVFRRVFSSIESNYVNDFAKAAQNEIDNLEKAGKLQAGQSLTAKQVFTLAAKTATKEVSTYAGDLAKDLLKNEIETVLSAFRGQNSALKNRIDTITDVNSQGLQLHDIRTGTETNRVALTGGIGYQFG